jgi:DNA invertase Pin-like site-specific DNA recombinase
MFKKQLTFEQRMIMFAPLQSRMEFKAMSTKPKRAVLYLRVSTDKQTVANQREALAAIAEQRGWQIVGEYSDAGISGAKGRDKRPGFDAMLNDATRAKFNVVLVWAVDRLSRSMPDLVHAMRDFEAAGVDLVVSQSGLDTTTDMGKAMFQMAGIFGELERKVIIARINAGLKRARAEGKRLGRARCDESVVGRARELLAAGNSIRSVAGETGLSVGTVHALSRG